MDTELAIRRLDEKLDIIINIMRRRERSKDCISCEDDSDFSLSEKEQGMIEESKNRRKIGNFGVSIEDINKKRLSNGLEAIEV